MLHSEDALAKAEQASQVLFGGEVTGLDAEDIQDIFAEVPSSDIPRHEIEGQGISLLDLLARTGLVSSKSEGRRLIDSGGIYVNNLQVQEVGQAVTLQNSIAGQFIVLRKGRKTYHLVRLQG